MPTVFIEHFLLGHLGAPIVTSGQSHVTPIVPPHHSSTSASGVTPPGDSIWTPFIFQRDWEIARWAKTHRVTYSAFSDLLAIPEVIERLELSYDSMKGLNDIIDNNLSGHPSFQCKVLHIENEHLDFYCRDMLQCIRTLYGDPAFAQELALSPVQVYTDAEKTCRVVNEMHTGDWWWSIQVCNETLESKRPGATVIPVILSSDKTLLTLFQSKVAYPVYMTIGNIPKDTRRKPSQRAQILIGYIPTTSFQGANLFHVCMEKVLAPIRPYGETGIAMMTADGIWHRCHPIFAVFIGDHPEQALAVVPSAKYRATSLGNLESFHPAPALMQSIYIV
ncbi:hypothetical protein V8E52_010654 [Russula decolorans]